MTQRARCSSLEDFCFRHFPAGTTHLESLEPATTQRGARGEPLPGLEAQPCSRRHRRVRLESVLYWRQQFHGPLLAEDGTALWVVPLLQGPR